MNSPAEQNSNYYIQSRGFRPQQEIYSPADFLVQTLTHQEQIPVLVTYESTELAFFLCC